MSPNNGIVRELLQKAHAVRDRAEHYGGFNVGCIGYYSDPSSEGTRIVIEGANTKYRPTDRPDCAEMKVMRDAEERGVVLEGMVIVGVPRKEDTTKTLHPCGERCRPLMERYLKKSTAVSASTHITCVNALNGDVEEFTVKELLELR